MNSRNLAFSKRLTARLLVVLMSIFFAVASAQEAELPTTQGPVLVTSLGQSLDAFQVQLMLGRTDVPFEYEQLAGVEMLEDKNTVFLVVGASIKGFGEAGISIEDELARTKSLINTAKENGIFIVVLHPGGQERRDDLSDQLIAVAAPSADLLLVREDSDEDGMFTNIAAEHEIPMVKFGNVINLGGTFDALFAQ